MKYWLGGVTVALLAGCANPPDPNALIGASGSDAIKCMGRPNEVTRSATAEAWMYYPVVNAPQRINESCASDRCNLYTPGREGAAIAAVAVSHPSLENRCSVALTVVDGTIRWINFISASGHPVPADKCPSDIPRCAKPTP